MSKTSNTTGFRALYKLLLLLLAGYAGVALWLYGIQRDLLFVRDHHTHATNGYYLKTDNHTKIWITVSNPGQSKALIYFPSIVEKNWADPDQISSLLPEHTLYFIHYRGYGQSSGKPTQSALYADALRLFDTIEHRYASVDLLGRSVGTAVAVLVAARREVGRVILVTPFANMTDIAKNQYPWLPPLLLLKDQFPSEYFAHDVKEPTLVIVSEQDEIVPRESISRLISKFPNKPEIITLRGADHENSIKHPIYNKALKDFLEK